MEAKPRGRPKTLKRDAVLNASMVALWDPGVAHISVNEICKRAQTSKAAIYREFKNEDGLLAASLKHYFENGLAPAFALLEGDAPFKETLDNLTELFFSGEQRGFPRGCLFQKMRENQRFFGPQTHAQIGAIQTAIHGYYQTWITASKADGRLVTDIETNRLAVYIDAQIANAMARETRHETTKDTRDILEMAFAHLA